VLVGKVAPLSFCILASCPIQDRELELESNIQNTEKDYLKAQCSAYTKIYTSGQDYVNKTNYALVPHVIVNQLNH